MFLVQPQGFTAEWDPMILYCCFSRLFLAALPSCFLISFGCAVCMAVMVQKIVKKVLDLNRVAYFRASWEDISLL